MSFDYEGLKKYNVDQIAKAEKERLERERKEADKDFGQETLKAIKGLT